MRCPVCGSSKNKVVDSVKTYTRSAGKKGYILSRLVTSLRMTDTGELARKGGVGRRRQCEHCSSSFITHEEVAQIMRTK
jgi:transcriptional regulator NrdR family protein